MTETKEDLSPRNVDLAVRTSIYEAAKARLAELAAHQRQMYGVQVTSLTDIGRLAVLHWRPDARTQIPTRKYRSPKYCAPERTPFRFKLPKDPYERAKQRIHSHGRSVTLVAEEALSKFARTGQLPKEK